MIRNLWLQNPLLGTLARGGEIRRMKGGFGCTSYKSQPRVQTLSSPHPRKLHPDSSRKINHTPRQLDFAGPFPFQVSTNEDLVDLRATGGVMLWAM